MKKRDCRENRASANIKEDCEHTRAAAISSIKQNTRNKRLIKEKVLTEILYEGQIFKKLMGRQVDDEEVSPKTELEAKATNCWAMKVI